MPDEFAEFATTRIILDCTEIFILHPSAMLVQSETWSDYKHHNTWKQLVGITPNGQVTFLSDLWGGRVSDKQITRESGVLDLLNSGDNVMVDRGLDIKDIVPDGVFSRTRSTDCIRDRGNYDHRLCANTRGEGNW